MFNYIHIKQIKTRMTKDSTNQKLLVEKILTNIGKLMCLECKGLVLLKINKMIKPSQAD